MVKTVPCGTVVERRRLACACGAMIGRVATNAAGSFYMSWLVRHVTMNPLEGGAVEMHGRCPNCNCLLIIQDLSTYLTSIFDKSREQAL